MDTSHPSPPWPHLFREGDGPVIVTLHGYGGNEEEVSGLASWLNPRATVLSPRGTVVESDTVRWYGRFTGSSFEPVDIDTRAGELIGFLREASDHYGFSLPDALISGFSNGAAMALALAVLYPQEVKQVAGFSGVLPFTVETAVDLSGLQLWWSYGDRDPWVSREAGQRAVDFCQDRSATVGSLVRPGGHGITPDEIDGARAFFGFDPSHR